MTRPKLLDLFCGAGGCSVGYARAGFDVYGVDLAAHADYPFPFYRGDAVALLDLATSPDIANHRATFHHRDGTAEVQSLTDFAVVVASPPCQRWSTITPDSSRDLHPDLIAPTRDALKKWGGLYVIENVEGARRELDHPIRICGSWFGLSVRRHRYFESNAPLLHGTDCLHRTQGRPIGVYGDHPQDDEHYRRPDGTRRGNKAKTIEEAQQALGIDWMTDWDDLTDAIPPAFTEHIGLQLIEQLAVAV